MGIIRILALGLAALSATSAQATARPLELPRSFVAHAAALPGLGHGASMELLLSDAALLATAYDGTGTARAMLSLTTHPRGIRLRGRAGEFELLAESGLGWVDAEAKLVETRYEVSLTAPGASAVLYRQSGLLDNGLPAGLAPASAFGKPKTVPGDADEGLLRQARSSADWPWLGALLHSAELRALAPGQFSAFLGGPPAGASDAGFDEKSVGACMGACGVAAGCAAAGGAMVVTGTGAVGGGVAVAIGAAATCGGAAGTCGACIGTGLYIIWNDWF